jgi:hypothetical protein
VKEQRVITESQPAPVPVFGRAGDPCPACGAPLAGDQRYCLHCGARRPEARLEFLDVLDADVRARGALPPTAVAPVVAAAAPPPPRGLNGRLQANAGLLALAALMLLTLLIGLLLGHWATDRASTSAPAAATPAPQVIRVEGATTAAPAATTGDSASGSAGAGSSKSSSKSTKSSAKSSKASAPKDAVSVDKLSSKKAVDDAVKKGKPISTGTGKLPPTDSKAPGGGSAIEEIG